MNVEIVPLNELLVPKAKELIAGYLHSDEGDKSNSSFECEQILRRFLSYDLAYCYLAKYGEEYVGSKGYPILRVDGLYSSPEHRNIGVGKKLMQHAIGLAIEKKAARLQLETDDDNHPASTLYTNLGFTRISGKGVYMLFI